MIITSDDSLENLEHMLIGAAHSKDVSIFGNDAFHDYLKSHKIDEFEPIYGHYAIINKQEGLIRIKTDHFGLFRLYIYRSHNVFAISDSMYALTRFAKSKSAKLTPYAPSAYAFLLRDGVGHQLSSFKTPIEEIELVPHWFDIQIDDAGLRFCKKQSVKWNEDVRSAIMETGQFFSSLVASYITHGMNPFILLSGGLDSRCTAAAMTCGLSISERQAIGSYTMKTGNFAKEREVAESLSNTLGLTKLDVSKAQRQPNWPEWKYCFLGAQSYFSKFPRFTPPDVVFGGSCAENIKPFYPWPNGLSDINISEKIPATIRPYIIEDMTEAVQIFDGMGKNVLTDDNKHYQMFRSRFHFGADLRDTIFNYPPLFYALLNSKESPNDVRPMHRIIYELSSQEVFLHKFDEDHKSFSGEAPKDWRKCSVEEVTPYARTVYYAQDILGHYTDLSGGARDCEYVGLKGSLLSQEFFEDCRLAIEYVERHGLFEETQLSDARGQMNHLRANGQKLLPFICPALMGALSLGMAE